MTQSRKRNPVSAVVGGQTKGFMQPNRHIVEKIRQTASLTQRGVPGRVLNKMAASQVVRALPKIYSPLYEMSNLMLPRDQRTINAWNRHFYLTNPYVRNCINLHATYPISKFQLSCKDVKVKNFFEDMFEHMQMRSLALSVSLEYWKLGESFPYLELDENNGWWDYGFVHNPDFIRVKTNVLARDPIIGLIPDDALRRLINSVNPNDAKLRQQLPDELWYYIQKGQDIPLSNFHVSHLKMLSSDYDVRGTSLVTACFKDLMLYDKIREAKYMQADDMINPITLVKLGDPNGTWKPNDDDISDFRNMMEEAQYDLNFKLVTHGAVTIEKVGAAGHTLDVTSDMELVIKNIITGLMTPEGVLHGEGPTYATAAVGLEVLRARYQRFRDQFETWVKKKVLEPICKIQDFYEYRGGEKKLIVPSIKWNKINLRDIDSYLNHLMGMAAEQPGTGKVSDETLFEFLDIDYADEKRKMRAQLIDELIRQREVEVLSKMTLDELRTLDLNKPIVDLHPEKKISEEVPGEMAELGGGEGLGMGLPGAELGGGEELGLGEGMEVGPGEATVEAPPTPPTPE